MYIKGNDCRFAERFLYAPLQRILTALCIEAPPQQMLGFDFDTLFLELLEAVSFVFLLRILLLFCRKAFLFLLCKLELFFRLLHARTHAQAA